MKSDFPSQFISRVAYKLHPKLGSFYTQHLEPIYHKHEQFFNDQFVEFIGLIIANIFVGLLSYYFVGLILVIVLLFVSTPITLIVKYMMRKHWVWKK